MTPENFTYWLQGLFELTDCDELSKEQVAMIKEHLELTLTKVTPPLLEETEISKKLDAATFTEHRPYYEPGGGPGIPDERVFCHYSSRVNSGAIC